MMWLLQISIAKQDVNSIGGEIGSGRDSSSCSDLSYIRYSAERIKKELSFHEASDFSCVRSVRRHASAPEFNICFYKFNVAIE